MTDKIEGKLSHVRAALQSVREGTPFTPQPIKRTRPEEEGHVHFVRELREAIEDQKKIVSYLEGKMIQEGASYSLKHDLESMRLRTLEEIMAQAKISFGS